MTVFYVKRDAYPKKRGTFGTQILPHPTIRSKSLISNEIKTVSPAFFVPKWQIMLILRGAKTGTFGTPLY
jgi:hypothetical protein